MTNDEFEQYYYPKYKNVISAIARKLARADADLYDDIVSVATIGLLESDPTKAASNPDAYIRNALRNKAVDHLRWLRRRNFERLDTYLRTGHDVVLDGITGQPKIVEGDNRLLVMSGDDEYGDAGGLRGYTPQGHCAPLSRDYDSENGGAE